MGGGEKALIEVEGVNLLERSLAVLRRLFGEVIVVTPRPEAIAASACGALLVEDLLEGCGPLGGIHAALRTCGAPHAFVAACDLACLDERAVAVVAGRAGTADVVMPRIAGRDQPLHAVYSKRLADEIETLLRGGRRAIRDLLTACDVLRLTETDFEGVPHLLSRFRNVNTPTDLEELRATLRSRER